MSNSPMLKVTDLGIYGDPLVYACDLRWFAWTCGSVSYDLALASVVGDRGFGESESGSPRGRPLSGETKPEEMEAKSRTRGAGATF